MPCAIVGGTGFGRRRWGAETGSVLSTEGTFKNWQKVISQPHVGGPGREPARLAGGDKNAETCGNGHQNQLLQQSSCGAPDLDSHQGFACALAPEGDI